MPSPRAGDARANTENKTSTIPASTKGARVCFARHRERSETIRVLSRDPIIRLWTLDFHHSSPSLESREIASVIIDVFICKFRFFCRTDYEETIHRCSFSETIGLALRVRTSLHSQRCGCVRLGGGGEGRREKMSRGEERGTSGSDVPGTRTTARERRREGGEERERVRTGASAIRAVIRQRRDE